MESVVLPVAAAPRVPYEKDVGSADVFACREEIEDFLVSRVQLMSRWPARFLSSYLGNLALISRLEATKRLRQEGERKRFGLRSAGEAVGGSARGRRGEAWPEEIEKHQV